MRAQRVLRDHAQVSVCVCVCSRQMDAFITYEDDDSQAAKKQSSKHEQAVSKMFRQCGFQGQPRRRRACRIVICLSSVRRHARIAMRDLYWSADRSRRWSRNQLAGEKRRGRIAQPTDRRWTASQAACTAGWQIRSIMRMQATHGDAAYRSMNDPMRFGMWVICKFLRR